MAVNAPEGVAAENTTKYTIAVFPNVAKERSPEILKRIIDFFKDRQVRVVMSQVKADYYGYQELAVRSFADEKIDFALSIGGDGTMLGVCRKLYGMDIPCCGINIGTVGFMTDIEVDELELRLQDLLDGNYTIEERTVISGGVMSRGAYRLLGHSLNDIVITKDGVARMLHLGLSINECHVTDYKADGVIVSTATGSTAYSLSAGGPIIHPSVKSLLITPICPHTLEARPMVISDSDEVIVHIAAVHQDIQITFDGQESFQLLPGDAVIIHKAEFPAKIVTFDERDYYHTLNSKLWHS